MTGSFFVMNRSQPQFDVYPQLTQIRNNNTAAADVTLTAAVVIIKSSNDLAEIETKPSRSQIDLTHQQIF